MHILIISPSPSDESISKLSLKDSVTFELRPGGVHVAKLLNTLSR